MHKKDRVRAALAGGQVDRPPAGFWGHDYAREWTPDGLAAAMLEGVKRHDWDFLKVNPRATYYSEAWGCTYAPSGDPYVGPVTKDYVLKSASDLSKIKRISGRDGVFAEQLQALRLIRNGIGEVDFIQTVFSPLSVLGRLADNDTQRVRGYIEDDAQAVHAALGAIAETLADYARASIENGASGIFFATTDWATSTTFERALYADFARPYDLAVLDAVQDAEFNVLHVCRSHNFLENLLDYPVAAFNWADREEGNASLADVLKRTDKAVMGGVEQADVLAAPPEGLANQVRDAIEATGGRRVLIAPGCSVAPRAPQANLDAIRKAVGP